MVSPSSVGTAIQHAGAAATTANRLSDRPLLSDICWTGPELSSENGPNREYKLSQPLADFAY
jgi:hypothetical protein